MAIELDSLESSSNSHLREPEHSVLLDTPVLQPRGPEAEEELSCPKVISVDLADQKQTDSPKLLVSPVGLFALFKYANRKEKLFLALGTFGAIVCGVLMAVYALLFGRLIDTLGDPTVDFMSEISNISLIFVYFGIGMLVGSFLEIYLFMYVSETLSKRIRELYLSSLLSQEIAWHDTSAGDMSVKLTASTSIYQAGIGEKLALIIQNTSSFIAGLSVAAYTGWELTLLLIAVAPVLGISTALMSSAAAGSAEEQKEYAQAGAVAHDTLSSIRTIASNQLEKLSIARYDKYLWDAYAVGKKKGIIQGTGMSSFMLGLSSIYGFGLWYGSTLIKDERERWPGAGLYTGGTIFTVFYAFFSAIINFSQSAPHFSAVASARAAAAPLFAVIERTSSIDSRSKEGLRVAPAAFTGRVRFRDVHFAYPSRPDAPIFKGLNLDIEPGFIALVGPSGCGKSSTVSLLERFYDPAEGSVQLELCVRGIEDPEASSPPADTLGTDSPGDTTLEITAAAASPALRDLSHWEVAPLDADGSVPAGCRLEYVDLRQLNVASLRAALGLVSQEPVLFAGTVRENIMYGNPALTEEDMHRCAKLANAHDFILKLQHGYDTQVGEGGRLLSGGQKQRVAIARMLAGERGIMMLDEATAALDNKSEALVQAALDRLVLRENGRKKTSIVIAHRLSTIRNADRIVVLDKGVVIESGSHEELMSIHNGVYRGLVLAADDVPVAQTNSATKKRVDASDSDKNAAFAECVDPDAVVEGADGDTTAYELEASLEPSVSRIGHALSLNAVEIAPQHATGRKTSAYRRLLSLSKTQWLAISLGTIAGMAEGCILPVYCIMKSTIAEALFDPDRSAMVDKTRLYGVYFFLLGVGAFAFAFARVALLAQAGEALMRYVRSTTFAAMLRQEIGWHDAHPAGVLAARLASDAMYVRSLVADRYGVVVNVLTNIVASFAICFASEGAWRMSLLMLTVVFPAMGAAGVITYKFMAGYASSSKDAIERAGQVATEGVSNLRTVAAFGRENALISRFKDILGEGLVAGRNSSFVAGAGYGAAQGTIYCCHALSFWFGGLMVDKGNLSFAVMLQVFMTIELASMLVGTLFQHAPELDRADAALQSIFDILDRPSLRDPLGEEGAKPELFNASGEEAGIQFRKVCFHYPTRPNVAVLKGIDFHCAPNTVTAIVSESGGGKSTIFALLQRFYDPIQFGATDGYRDGIDTAQIAPYIMSDPNNPDMEPKLVPCDREEAGTILINGHDISDVNIAHLRSRIGVVGQEPVLMSGTIADNIRAGDDTMTDEDVENAARMANIHDTIVDRFPEQYQTDVGNKGGQLSGGQKQRIALARAFARIGLGVDASGAVVRRGDANTLLLLDEATSALDNVSEKLVQSALDKAMQCTTTLVIAHRLTTVRNAHKIVVLGGHEVVETGTHEELMRLKGHYYHFVCSHEDDKDKSM